VQQAGAVAVPISTSLRQPEVEHVLAACAAVLAIGADPRHPLSRPRYVPLADVEAGATGVSTEVRARPQDLGQILFTSGTTGEPKGVGATHDNLTFGCELSPRRRAFEHSEHFVHAFPIGTTAAQAMLLHTIVVHPAALVLEKFDPELFCSVVEEFGVGTAFLVPAMAIELLNTRAYERYDVSSLEVISSTGAALPPPVAQSLVQAFPDSTIFNNYSSTEALPAQVMMMIDPDRPDSVGLPIGTAEISIRGADGAELPAGEVGEVWLHCPTTPRMYYGDAEATARTFQHGWVRMGDLGRLDEDGHLYLVDRDRDLIQVGGLRVSTTEVEAALLEHPGVREAAVFGLPHPVMGTMVAAAVVLGDGTGTRALRAYLRDRIAPHKVPVRWLTVDRLPRNRMGKVTKQVLRDRMARQAGDRAAADAP
jgi:acyl-coenzyme A synthetase/AMP-(fatty) acid ligase